MIVENGKKLVVVAIGAFLYAFAMNVFLIPASVLSAGFTGVAQLLNAILHQFADMTVSTGTIVLLLNIPVMFLGWFKVGRSFTIYSLISVVLLSFFLRIIPVTAYSDEIMLNAVFGGVIGGIGGGITFRYGASQGGMDIITSAISKATGKSVGALFMVLNGVLVISAATVFDKEKALFTLVSIFVMSRVIDTIHTSHEKLTLIVVTDKAAELTEVIYNSTVRGITVIPAKGGFTGNPKEVLMMVITRYELYDIKKIIQEVDPKSFTNIMTTSDVIGFFHRDVDKPKRKLPAGIK